MDLKKVLDQTVRELRREVNKKVLKVPEIEIKVLEATSNEPWGPHGTIMGDIAHATRNFQEYHMIMGVLWKRLHDSGKNWRHVYKSLTVMEYLIANGAERVIDELREQAYQIQALLDFQYIEPNGKDQGINVQKKAQSLLALINDRGKIRELRQKAAANRDKYRGLSSSGMTFKPSSYISTSVDDDQQFGGGPSAKLDNELDSRSQRVSIRDDCSCGEKEHNEGCASSKGAGDRNSDNLSSTDGDRNHDFDEYRHYSRCSGNRGVVAAVTRAQTSLSQYSSNNSGQSKSGRELFFTIKSVAADDFHDFDPRATSKPSVPVAKDHDPSTQSSQRAFEDLFADVEFQASFPPLPATARNNVSEQDHLLNQISKSNSTMKEAFPSQAHETSFNPSFASFNESPSPEIINGGFHPIRNHEQFKVGPAASTEDLFSSLNPFSTKDGQGNYQTQQQPPPPPVQTNPFLSTTSSSAFWDDPLITSLVDLTIGRGQKQDQLSMNEISTNIAVSRANSLQMGTATTLSSGGRQSNNTILPGRSASEIPKSS